jgi:hypothetical protein
MIRRLVEANYTQRRESPNPQQIEFWLQECRTVSLLLELAQRFPNRLLAATGVRPLLALAGPGDEVGLAGALEAEEKHEREADRLYWLPLRKELEALRHQRLRGAPPAL